MTLAPRRLAGLQWQAADVLPRNPHVAQRLRHPDLGREVRAEGEVTHRLEPRLPPNRAHERLAVRARQLEEVVGAKALEPLADRALVSRLVAVAQNEVHRRAGAGRLRAW